MVCVRVFSAYIKVHGLVHLAARLRCLCRETRDFFFFDFFLESSDLVERGNWKKTKFWKAFRWFCTIPPFQEDYSRFPFFCHRGAMQRLIQGFMRQMYVTKHEKRMYLVGLVQPSLNWTAKRLVFFRFDKTEQSKGTGVSSDHSSVSCAQRNRHASQNDDYEYY